MPPKGQSAPAAVTERQDRVTVTGRIATLPRFGETKSGKPKVEFKLAEHYTGIEYQRNSAPTNGRRCFSEETCLSSGTRGEQPASESGTL